MKPRWQKAKPKVIPVLVGGRTPVSKLTEAQVMSRCVWVEGEPFRSDAFAGGNGSLLMNTHIVHEDGTRQPIRLDCFELLSEFAETVELVKWEDFIK